MIVLEGSKHARNQIRNNMVLTFFSSILMVIEIYCDEYNGMDSNIKVI
jgi:hypothetical protein